ncbi:hypothetical protein [Arenibacterium sp. LLYu02]|uniref:hypothetical protein n=1 Tax=Arenibacterium sp. LLYu02 TaxID=3404132 RepID=UPI003B20BE72
MPLHQLNMFDLLEPPAPVVRRQPIEYTHRPLPTRAYGRDYVMQIRVEERDPIEIEVRGVPALITFGYGFSTYTVQPHGSLFWSHTGFRSWAGFHGAVEAEPDTITALIERLYRRPYVKDGLGGQPERWWPSYALQWRYTTGFILEFGRDRSRLWAQWGPERHAELWAKKEREFRAGLSQMEADGTDPNDLPPRRGFKGQRPRFNFDSQLSEFSA